METQPPDDEQDAPQTDHGADQDAEPAGRPDDSEDRDQAEG